MRNLAVFCSGNGSNFEAILRAVRRGKLKARVALMVCDNPKAYALERARKHQIPVVLISPKLFSKRQDYEKIIARILKNQQVDLVVLAGFMRILTPTFIHAYRDKIINIHPSYLPAFKGAHAIRDAFEAGVRETGVTVHRVTAEVDAGRVILQRRVKISKKDTLTSLEAKIHRVEHQLYPLAIQRYLSTGPRP
jgi:phosphoribosylglycinamide formyltransferase-1